jgi:hypothetical protein
MPAVPQFLLSARELEFETGMNGAVRSQATTCLHAFGPSREQSYPDCALEFPVHQGKYREFINRQRFWFEGRAK